MAFWRLYYHLIWATKDREPLIEPQIKDMVYGYIIRKAAEMQVYVHAIGGVDDHLHLVVAIPPKHGVADVVKRLKGASSHFLNSQAGLEFQFAWQRGYGALSLGERQKPDAIAYVEHQVTHHQEHTTNSWLEHSAELDEGPEDAGMMVDAVRSVLHEPQASYGAPDEPPF